MKSNCQIEEKEQKWEGTREQADSRHDGFEERESE